MPRRRTLVRIASCCILAILTFSGSTMAQSRSNATFTGRVQLPGVVLSAGTYRFVHVASYGLVVVSDATGHVVATVSVRRATRPAPGTIIALRQALPGAAPEVAAWYSSGGTEGLEFIYQREDK
jgi:hypothetical protein